MDSPSSRSTAPSTDPRRRPAGVDVYLLPAVVGGGLGDVQEVLAAGRVLARAGRRLTLYRHPDRPLPRDVEGPWGWPPHRRVSRLAPRFSSALTIAPAWGVSAAPPSAGPFGRPGPWAAEAADIEAAYGPERTLHVSLEEFARTLTTARESVERLREGGIRARQIRERLRGAAARAERVEFARAFRRFRAFDRSNVLPLFAGFTPDAAFGREFPEAVQTGPLWPESYRPADRPRVPRAEWVWYASPASAESILPDVLEGLEAAGRETGLFVRSPRPWRRAVPPARGGLADGPLADRTWRRRFREAELRIVTGSRTLLEALELGGPFLYFNGVLGVGPSRRRHRPEKIDALLAAGRAGGWPTELLRDLADFARGRRIPDVVRRAAGRIGPWGRSMPRLPRGRYRPDLADLGRLLVRLADDLGDGDRSSDELIDELRSRGGLRR